MSGAHSASAEVLLLGVKPGYYGDFDMFNAVNSGIFAVCNSARPSRIEFHSPNDTQSRNYHFENAVVAFADSVIMVEDELWLNLQPPIGQARDSNYTLGLVKLANMNCMLGDQVKNE
ncbi:hypothetical protein [Ruegeria meonggei]|uniref:hypothetical protein n=1 Tax=Ruegeria meonggei TaxID=1446476 RepID=UPI00366B468B